MKINDISIRTKLFAAFLFLVVVFAVLMIVRYVVSGSNAPVGLSWLVTDGGIPLLINVISAIIVGIVFEISAQFFIVKRVRRLAVVAKEYGDGNFKNELLEDGKDELGSLAKSLNEMVRDIKVSNIKLEATSKESLALRRLLQKLGSSLEIDSIMKSIVESTQELFPDVTVSYITAPISVKTTPSVVYVYAPGKIGEQYLTDIKNTLLLGLDTMPTLKASVSIFDTWRARAFEVDVIAGDRSIQDLDIAKSSLNIPLIIPQSIAGFFNFSSESEDVFTESEINTLYTIVSCASEAVVRLKRMIRSEEERVGNLVESIGDGVVVVDRSWNILLLNKAASQISGFSKEEVVDKPFREMLKIVRVRDRKEDISFIEKAMAEKTTQSISEPMVLIAKDGREIPLGDSAAPYIDQAGEVIGAIVVFRDITLEREAHGLKSDFAYASHQLRTPVSKAMWNLEVVLGADNIEEIKTAAQVSYNSLKSVQKLSEALLDVSRIDQGEIIAEKELVLISDVITEAIEKVKKTIEEKHVSLKADIPEGVQATTNKKLLMKAISAILENAALYNHAEGNIEIKAQKEEGNILIQIIDSGIGIADEHSPLIFTKFFRGSNYDTTAIAGAGLGLYVAREYILILGGKIWFKSEEKIGTTFFVSLPILWDSYTARVTVEK